MALLGFVLNGLLTLLALASAANACLAPSAGLCRDGWTYVEKTHNCYKAIFDAETSEGALKACQRWDATLPIIHDIATDKALRDYAVKHVDEEYFHIGLRRNLNSGQWQWTDGSKVDYTRWEAAPLESSPVCAWASFGVSSPTSLWRPVECNSWERSYICVARASGSSPTTHGVTSNGTLPSTTAPSGPVNDGTTKEDVETGKNCEDAVAAWKCKTLKTVYACKASKYISYPEQNCAKTCGFCT